MSRTVYVEDEGTIRECLVWQDVHNSEEKILKVKGTEDFLIATERDMFDTPTACLEDYQKRMQREYKKYYSQMTSLEELLSHLILATKSNIPAGKMEMAAAIKRASEFSGIDMGYYLKRYKEDEQKVKRTYEH